jgi:hypothetical protein
MTKTNNMKSKFKLKCEAGIYESDSFFQLVIEVLKHRFWHLRKHGKWID